MNIETKEVDILREIAYAAENFQQVSRYTSGDFSRVYAALEKWKKYKNQVSKRELGVELPAERLEILE
jgi:hypothetical protein